MNTIKKGYANDFKSLGGILKKKQLLKGGMDACVVYFGRCME